MPVLGGIEILIQFCFAFHALRSGRPYWWVFVIMAFPVLGCVIYYLVEVFPASRECRQLHRAARRIGSVLQPDAGLKQRAEALAICGSIENRMALAEECMNHQMPGEAAKLYESCLAGVFERDGALLFGLLRASVEDRQWEKAAGALDKLKRAASDQRPQETRLLEARLFEGLGQSDRALAAYRALVPVYVGLEARYRLGELLHRLGHHEAAMRTFDDLVVHSRRYSSLVESEHRWAEAARHALDRRLAA